jgi:hypothetical protein
MTGRAAGYCSGSSKPGYANPNVPIYGRGFGRGGGRGFGRGYWGRGRFYRGRGCYPDPNFSPEQFYPQYQQPVSGEYNKEEEKKYLEDMVIGLEEEIKTIKERLQELSKEKKKEP